MKKSLIALAVLSTIAGSVAAQSSVTVSGRIDMGFSDKTLNPVAITPASSAVTTAGDLKTKDVANSPMYTSFLRFNGSEDIGGGLKANFFMETSLLNNPSKLGDRGMWVELAGGFGSLRAGTQNSISRDVWISNAQTGSINIVGDLNSSTAEDAGGTAGVLGFETAIKYTTPRMNGFQASAAMTSATIDTNGEKTGSDGSSFGLSYAAGKLAFIAGYSSGTAYTGATSDSYAVTGAAACTQSTTVACSAADFASPTTDAFIKTTFTAAAPKYETKTDITAIGANYDFGAVKAALTYVDKDVKRNNTATTGAVDRQTTTLSAQTQNLGKVVLFGSYGVGDQTTANNGYKGDLTAMQVGVKYNLSKRTQSYLATGTVEHDLSATTKTDYKETAIGLVHVF
jgi:predicted porin